MEGRSKKQNYYNKIMKLTLTNGNQKSLKALSQEAMQKCNNISTKNFNDKKVWWLANLARHTRVNYAVGSSPTGSITKQLMK